MSYDPNKLWSETEDNAVRTYYAKFGPSWQGWQEVLPSRTKRAIKDRARRLGVAPHKPVRKSEPKPAKPEDRRYKVNNQRDPHEPYVMKCMRNGMTPSEIDKAKHWPPNTTKRILMGRWERERRLAEEYDANRKGKKVR